MDPVATFVLVGQQPWARLMVESVKQVLGYKVVQLSDFETPVVDGVDEVIRKPSGPLMPFRLKHLAECPYDKWVTFDTDVIVKRPLGDVWFRNFDVALTERGGGKCLDPNGKDIAPHMPFNTGVMFSRAPAFWRDCYEWLKQQPDQAQHWWGDQLAVAYLAHMKRYHVLVLPGKEFNWTPEKPEETSNARCWHYKGSRKAWIIDGEKARLS